MKCGVGFSSITAQILVDAIIIGKSLAHVPRCSSLSDFPRCEFSGEIRAPCPLSAITFPVFPVCAEICGLQLLESNLLHISVINHSTYMYR